MSISSDLTRIQNAKSSLATSITNKGVTVPPGTKIDGFAALVDQISGGGGSGYVTETGTWTPSVDTDRGTIQFANTHTKPPAFYIIMDSTENLTIPSSTILYNSFIDTYQFFGIFMPRTSSTEVYALANYSYKGSSSASQGNVFCSYAYTNPGSQSVFYSRYWATETEFYPYSYSTSRSWRSTRTYKWLAIWV